MEIIYYGKNFKLLKEHELHDLLDILTEYLPESLKFHQTLKTYLKDRVWNFHFYVANNWPEELVCLHFPGVTQTITGDIYDSFGIFCPLNRLECLQLLQDENVLIDWTKPIYINYTHEEIVERIEYFYKDIGTLREKVYGDFYVYDKDMDVLDEDSTKCLRDERIRFKEISKEEVKMIYDLYPVRDFENILVFERLIEKLPCCGVYINGELVAWMMQSYYGAMCSMQTKPGYRRQGFGKQIAKHLTQLVHCRGYVPFVVIIADNTISKNLYINLGFKKLYRNIRTLICPYKNHHETTEHYHHLKI